LYQYGCAGTFHMGLHTNLLHVHVVMLSFEVSKIRGRLMKPIRLFKIIFHDIWAGTFHQYVSDQIFIARSIVYLTLLSFRLRH